MSPARSLGPDLSRRYFGTPGIHLVGPNPWFATHVYV